MQLALAWLSCLARLLPQAAVVLRRSGRVKFLFLFFPGLIEAAELRAREQNGYISSKRGKGHRSLAGW